MNLNKLFDLRFVIGSFFSIVAILLLVHGVFFEQGEGSSINKACGGFFLIFGIVMIILSLRKDAGDELPVED